jgi:hypothetical protein
MAVSIGLAFAVVFLIVGFLFVAVRVLIAKKAVKPSSQKASTVLMPSENREGFTFERSVFTPPAQSNLDKFSNDDLFKETANRIKSEAESLHLTKVFEEAKAVMVGRLTPVPAAFTPTQNPNPAAIPPAPILNPVVAPAPAVAAPAPAVAAEASAGIQPA